MAGLLVVARGRACARPRVLRALGLGGRARSSPPPADDWDCDFVKDEVDNCPPHRLRRPDAPQPEPGELPTATRWATGATTTTTTTASLDWTDGGYDYQPNRVKRDNCRIDRQPRSGRTTNRNGVGDACEYDNDGDGVFDTEDNCRDDANPDQADMDGDRNGDACDNDLDGDFVRNSVDNCPAIANPQVPPDWIQPDDDGDGIGNACEPAPPVP